MYTYVYIYIYIYIERERERGDITILKIVRVSAGKIIFISLKSLVTGKTV